MCKVILHVFTVADVPNEAWIKVKGEPSGVYAFDDISRERLHDAKNLAKKRLQQAYFPNLCYVLRSYVWSEEEKKVVFSYRREIVEREGE